MRLAHGQSRSRPAACRDGAGAQHAADADAPPSQPLGSITTTRSTRDPDPNPSMDDLLKSRGPGHHQHQPGPSLLTQALASARGIPTQNANAASNQPNHEGNSTDPTASKPSASHEPEISNNSPASLPAQQTKNGGLQTTIDRDAVQPAPTMATPATISTINPPMDINTATHPTSAPRYMPPREVMEHQGFLQRAQGRASTSLDIERPGAELLKERTYSLSTSPDESTTPTDQSYIKEPRKIPPTGADAGSWVSQESLMRPPPGLAQRVTISPGKKEKIWSIGSGDGQEEDGLVEKSVAEAMAGIEHNARSRKASYSLRFFKEGLPQEDRPRRKDTKQTPRETLSPTTEDVMVTGTSRAQTTLRSETGQGPKSTPHDDSQPRSTSDYFGALVDDEMTGESTPVAAASPVKPASHGAKQSEPPPPTVGPIPAPKPESVEGQPRSADGSRRDQTATGAKTTGGIAPDSPPQNEHAGDGVCESGPPNHGSDASPGAGTDSAEDADESGEEKISSAVFLPHQEMPDAREHPAAVVMGDNVRQQRPRTISHSNSHPWLVKADEPEPEPEPEADMEPKGEEPEPPLMEAVGLPVSEKPRSRTLDAAAREMLGPVDSTNVPVKGIVHVQPAQGVIATPSEDPVHNQHHQDQKPLEAIELIPYKHQVGGHTTLWRFSRRAVCKQLNNRENEFYETIERYHRELLPFLPR